ncbi:MULTISPECIES: LysR substrate-binding domain-containing protein [Pandoraea]|uniref:LysR family transcriptional regulator n=1 Tax=Pandoraea capi TaxID=2508286 RepID=A0ABY6W0A4_9BURK|nr:MULTISPECIES: LysR substrate-binding domain-containing protein [Pandoraea]MCI3208298.1 hypothetical protein [Pandoraea sp. LA3]MDN4586327.1 hypothetical protein [Pandoraea capi]VVD84238.1 LysR family transcriptional regulator [Pandoraea capi]
MNPLRTRLKIRHIQVVLAIADMGNLLRAAQVLNISQPAISKALSDVEDVVGERLFDRTPFGTRATPAGDALIQYGRNVLADMDRMHDALSAIKRGDAGKLRVGVFSLISQWTPFMRALSRLQASSRGILLTVEDGNMEDLMPKLDGGGLDIVVGRYPFASQQAHHTVKGLCADRIVAVVRNDHPVLTLGAIGFDDLVQYPWILPPERNIVRLQLEMELAACGLRFRDTPISSLVIPLNTRFVQNTDAVMLMPSCTALEHVRAESLAIVPFDLPISVGPLIAIWRSERIVDRLRDTFVNALSAEAEGTAA